MTNTTNTAPAGIDLDSLTRYDSFETDEGDELRVDPTGRWVRFDDVESLLARRAAEAAPAATSVKTWQERLRLCPEKHEVREAMCDEIADLRAALAQQSSHSTAAVVAADEEISGAEMHDVVHQLREYASNAGYSHSDCVDTMLQAANCIESLRARFWNYAGLSQFANGEDAGQPAQAVDAPSAIALDFAPGMALRKVSDGWIVVVDGQPARRLNTMEASLVNSTLRAASPAAAPDAAPVCPCTNVQIENSDDGAAGCIGQCPASEAAQADDGDVTEEMIQAGIAALTLTAQSAPNAELAVTTIYRAMSAAAPVAAVAPSDATGKAVTLPLELAQRCLSSMKQAVTFGETSKGRPPSQTCLFEIEELEAILKGQFSIGTTGKAVAASAGGLLPLPEPAWARFGSDGSDAYSARQMQEYARANQSPATIAANAGEMLTLLKDAARAWNKEADSELDETMERIECFLISSRAAASQSPATSAADAKDAARHVPEHIARGIRLYGQYRADGEIIAERKFAEVLWDIDAAIAASRKGDAS
jgi:hypothetical protein